MNMSTFLVGVRVRCFLLTIWVLLLGGCLGEKEVSPWEVSLEVEMGPDRGQSLGSLFEAKDVEGVIAGAGFVDSYSTYVRQNHRQVQFFVRQSETKLKRAVIGNPTDGCHRVTLHRGEKGLEEFECGGELSSPGSGWRKRPELAKYFSVQYVGNKPLKLERNRVVFGDDVVLDDLQTSSRPSFYYNLGKLFVTLTKKRVLVCPWVPEQPLIRAKCKTARLNLPREFPMTFGEFEGHVYLGTNRGGVYRYSSKAGLVELDRAKDGQFYTMINYLDRFLIGHYPHGVFYELKGKNLHKLSGWPKVPEGANSGNREAQTSIIFGGELYLGLWPWGELWRRDRGSREWMYVDRLFTHPPISKSATPYYERVMEAHPKSTEGYDSCGQRIGSAELWGSSLVLGTWSKTGRLLPNCSMLSEKEKKEYGMVHQLTGPLTLTVPIVWKSEGSSKFTFRRTGTGISIEQDGVNLGRYEGEGAGQLPQSISLGFGVFGKTRLQSLTGGNIRSLKLSE